jgi:dGTPase
MGLIPKKTGDDIGFERHPAYLVKRLMIFAILYIDFEDGINLGLVSEDFALEYLIKLVKTVLTHQNIKRLQPKEDRISYLRSGDW